MRGGVQALGFVAVLALAACARAPADIATVTADDMTMGAADAPVTLIEYASVTCAHCAAFNRDILPGLKTKYIDTGKVRYVYREYLTPPENVSAAGSLLARCAGRDKYFQMVDTIMRAQPEMFADNTTDDALPVLRRIGQSAGLSAAEVDRCMTDSKGLLRIQAEMKVYDKAYHIGDNGTPAFYVNGKQVERTKGDMSDFDAALTPLLTTH
jgi:protein-disulfide isomerase